MANPMRPHFDSSVFAEQMRQIDLEAERIFGEVSEEEATVAAPGGWSVAQCIGHLNLTTASFLLAWKAAEKMPAVEGAAPRAYGWLQRQMLGWMEPPYRIKTKTQAAFLPGASESWPVVRDRFRTGQQRVLAAASEAQAFAMDTNKVQSPFASWLKYPLGFSFDVFAAHQRRHLWQADRILDGMHSPAGRAVR